MIDRLLYAALALASCPDARERMMRLLKLIFASAVLAALVSPTTADDNPSACIAITTCRNVVGKAITTTLAASAKAQVAIKRHTCTASGDEFPNDTTGLFDQLSEADADTVLEIHRYLFIATVPNQATWRSIQKTYCEAIP